MLQSLSCIHSFEIALIQIISKHVSLNFSQLFGYQAR